MSGVTVGEVLACPDWCSLASHGRRADGSRVHYGPEFKHGVAVRAVEGPDGSLTSIKVLPGAGDLGVVDAVEFAAEVEKAATFVATAWPTPPPCPPWCGGLDEHHDEDRDEKTHAFDRGVQHQSPVIDKWESAAEDATEPIVVFVEGFTHDSRDGDWPPIVRVGGSICPGFVSGADLQAVDARRLAAALVLAADLLEGRA